jgi:hypothetical protein
MGAFGHENSTFYVTGYIVTYLVNAVNNFWQICTKQIDGSGLLLLVMCLCLHQQLFRTSKVGFLDDNSVQIVCFLL